MKVKYLGHAAFLITTADGTKIVTDPYEPGGFGGAIAYGPLDEPADFVTISHQHADHNYVAMVPGSPTVISQTAHGVSSTSRLPSNGPIRYSSSSLMITCAQWFRNSAGSFAVGPASFRVGDAGCSGTVSNSISESPGVYSATLILSSF